MQAARPHASLPSTLLFVAFLPMLAMSSRTEACPPVGEDPGAGADQALAASAASDRTDLRAAYERRRHAITPVDGGYLARNPGQAWTLRFDGRGFSVRPDGDHWTWGLELERYGFEGSEQRPGEPSETRVEGGRVVYTWSGELEEWFINDARGLEHGYSVQRRPDGGATSAGGRLTFALAVRGELRPELDADGRGLRFLEEGGACALTYRGLVVFDATQRELEARFSLVAGQLLLSIDERDAVYPLTIDPVAQQAYLKASNTQTGDNFGDSVAISGDTAVIGAPYEDSNASGVNGPQGNNGMSASGAAYVFVRNGATWSQQAYLKASNPGINDRFGSAVAISEDTIVIGAKYEDSNATGVDGNQANNGLFDAGAAYVFVRNGSAWSQQAYLKAANTGDSDYFGDSVSISADSVVIGASGEDGGSTGVDGDAASNSASNSGAAYVFVRSGSSWSQQAYLKASNTGANDGFGLSAAISGDLVVVGAYRESSNATVIDGPGGNDSATYAGAAYVFARSGATWTHEAYLKASNAEQYDRFGISVAASGDTLVVGAFTENSSATGVNGNQFNNNAVSAGAAYVFGRDGSGWSQEAYLKASNSDAGDEFGGSVAISGDWVLVGARYEQSSSVGIDGDGSNDDQPVAGAAYTFSRDGAGWSPRAYLKASNTGPDWFGHELALSNETALVGALFESSSASGVDGAQGLDNAPGAGAAYVFDLDTGPTAVAYCFGDGSGAACPCGNDNDGSLFQGLAGCANGSFASGARLGVVGSASVSADDLRLAAQGLVPGQPGLFFQGTGTPGAGDGLAFGDGLRCAGGAVVRLGVVFANAGGFSNSLGFSVVQTGAVVPGDLRRYQYWYRDPQGSPCGSGFNLTNGVEVLWTP